MNTDDQRPYRAMVWLGNAPGQRVEVTARSLDEAEQLIKEQYGKDAVISLWNEDDAQTPR